MTRFPFKTTLLALACSTGLATPALAGPAADQMGECLVRSTSGQDRIDLVRWIVMAYAKHPDVASFLTGDASVETDLHQNTAALFTRLVTEDCMAESRAAVAAEGDAAFEVSFGVLGQVAAQELMRDQGVNATILKFLDYVDTAKLDAVFQ